MKKIIVVFFLLISISNSAECTSHKSVNLVRSIAEAINSEPFIQNCKEAAKHFFDFQAIYQIHSTSGTINSNRAYVYAMTSFDNDNKDSKINLSYYLEAQESMKTQHPDIWKDCGFTAGEHKISNKPLSGENNPICLVASAQYVHNRVNKDNPIREKDVLTPQQRALSRQEKDKILEDLIKTRAAKALDQQVKLRLVTQPNGLNDRFKNHVAKSCLNEHTENKLIELFDIKIFDNLQVAQDHFEQNLELQKSIDKKIAPSFTTTVVPCSEALSFIDKQADFWYSYLIAADTLLTDANQNNYEKYSLTIQRSHVSTTDIVLSYVIRYASHILSSDGYLKQNMNNFYSQCMNPSINVDIAQVVAKKDVEGIYGYGKKDKDGHGSLGKGLLTHIEKTLDKRKKDYFDAKQKNPNENQDFSSVQKP